MQSSTQSTIRLLSILSLIFSLTVLSLSTTIAQTPNSRWYVSTTGNNTNNGMTPATAWRSMQFANDNTLVRNGDTISVLAGNYSELVSITKSLKFYGPNFNTSPNTATRSAEATISMAPIIFDVHTPATTIEVKGFKLMNGAPITDGNYQRITQDITVLFEKNWVSQGSNLFAGSFSRWRTITIMDNYFENIVLMATSSAIQINADAIVTIADNRINTTSFAGILLDGVLSANVSRNVIRNTPNEAAIQLAGAVGSAIVNQNDIQFANSAAGVDAGGIRIFGSLFTGSVRIINNVVRNARNGFAVRNGENISGKNIAVNNNYFDGSNSSYSIYNGGTGTLEATCNLNTSPTPPVASRVFGAVNFQPYLTSANDSDPSMPGFQPTAGSCNGFDPALPLLITSIKGYSKNDGIQIEWSAQSEDNIERYELEKSQNGRQFNKVKITKPLYSSTTSNYNWFDASPYTGVNYYRIAMIDKDSRLKYTQTVTVKIGKGLPGIAVYPNPIVGNHVVLQMNNMKRGAYSITLTNKLGQQVFTKRLENVSLSFTQTIQLRNVPAGTYQLRIIGEGSRFVQQVIKSE